MPPDFRRPIDPLTAGAAIRRNGIDGRGNAFGHRAAIFGGFFPIAGVRNFLQFGERREAQTNNGWPLPAPLLPAGLAMQLLGGLALIFNIRTAIAALALVAFREPASALYHNLFLFTGKERDPLLWPTLVNITLAGGLLRVMAGAV